MVRCDPAIPAARHFVHNGHEDSNDALGAFQGLCRRSLAWDSGDHHGEGTGTSIGKHLSSFVVTSIGFS